MAALAGLTGSAITLTTKPNSVYHGTVVTASPTAITLNDVTQPNNPSAPLTPSLTVNPADVLSWASQKSSFRTDADISVKKALSKAGERELQAWQPDQPASDSDTFDITGNSGRPWDQFAANETMFGVKTSWDEETYTTKLDRSAPDFKEKEMKANLLANSINGVASNNPHIQEERVQNLNADGSGTNEEDKYSSVPRSLNAYVPPGARRGTPGSPPPPGAKPSPTPISGINNSDSKIPTVDVGSLNKDSNEQKVRGSLGRDTATN